MPCCGWLKRLTICYRCFCLNELFLVLQEICVQRTLINSILLIFWFCFVLHCPSFQCLFCKCSTSFLPCMVHKIKMPSEKYIYPNALRKGGRECLACPPPGYQDQGYLAWFSPDLPYSHLSEKSTNWAMLPILVNFTN